MEVRFLLGLFHSLQYLGRLEDRFHVFFGECGQGADDAAVDPVDWGDFYLVYDFIEVDDVLESDLVVLDSGDVAFDGSVPHALGGRCGLFSHECI